MEEKDTFIVGILNFPYAFRSFVLGIQTCLCFKKKSCLEYKDCNFAKIFPNIKLKLDLVHFCMLNNNIVF